MTTVLPLNVNIPPPDPVYSQTKKSDTAIVIDLGSHKTIAGWADERHPFLNFQSLVARGKVNGKLRSIVGSDIDHFPTTNIASPFVSDVPINFSNIEAIFDHVFGHLGIKEKIQHSVLLTEPVCCPQYTRQLMGELLFECYNVPRVGFGVDALFSYYYHKRNSLESLPIESALVLRSGNVTSHVLPIVEGKCRARNIPNTCPPSSVSHL
eukprot:TRINITY_DN2398_c0_g1_i24.p1 TRINITY_DN2398_c0_g1~~TRINITY_DN2398_c0_g1_i24.p1  ORF type:complete len:209 (+),score=26.85 TRINITY_DN2398_c0_g1_i24:77-703(+)